MKHLHVSLRVSELASAAQDCSRVANPQHPLLLLEALESSPCRVLLAAYNGEAALRVEAPCEPYTKADGSWAIATDAKKLYSICNTLHPKALVHLKFNGKSMVEVTCEDAAWKLPALPPEEFPAILGLPKEPIKWKIPELQLKSAIQRVLFLADDDAPTALLAGVHFTKEADCVDVVCTDGNRLARTMLKLHEPAECSSRFLLPCDSVKRLLPLLQSETNLVAVMEGGQDVHFAVQTHGGHYLTIYSVRCLVGKPVSWRKFIPEATGSVTVTFKKQELLEALKKQLTIAVDDNAFAMVELKDYHPIAPPALSMRSVVKQVGLVSTSVEFAVVSGDFTDTRETAWNCEKAMGILSGVKGDSVQMQFPVNGSTKPIVLSDPDYDSNWFGCLCPMARRDDVPSRSS